VLDSGERFHRKNMFSLISAVYLKKARENSEIQSNGREYVGEGYLK
jgi:hypothetical protein